MLFFLKIWLFLDIESRKSLESCNFLFFGQCHRYLIEIDCWCSAQLACLWPPQISWLTSAALAWKFTNLVPATGAILFYSWYAADFCMNYPNQQSISLDIYGINWGNQDFSRQSRLFKICQDFLRFIEISQHYPDFFERLYV